MRAILSALALSLALPALAQGNLCATAWEQIASRFRTVQSLPTEDANALLFSDLSDAVVAKLGTAPSLSEVGPHLPPYLVAMLKRIPEVTQDQLFEAAGKLPTDPESRTDQEIEYWQLRFQMFWGGGLRHPRDIQRLAVLEIRAAQIASITGRDHGKQARDTAIFEDQSKLLTTGNTEQRVEAVTRLAELGDSRSLALLEQTYHKDPKLAVRTQARIALIARGIPIEYDPQTLSDVRHGRFDDVERAYSLAHEELARMPDDALAKILTNSWLKILDNEHSRDLFRNRKLAFIRNYLADSDPWIRGIALRGLQGRYEPEILKLYQAGLSDTNVYVRTEAIEGLAGRRDPESRALLARTAQESKNPLIRDLAQKALTDNAPVDGRLSDADVKTRLKAGQWSDTLEATADLRHRPLDVIAAALDSPRPEVRLRAIQALADRRDPGSLQLLAQAFNPQIEPVADVRIAALDALFSIKSMESDHLISTAFLDRNDRVREHAVLKAQGDDVLRALINRPLQDARVIARASKRRLAAFNEAAVRADHQATLAAAEHVYELPEAGAVRSGSDLVKQYRRFLAGVPGGQRILLAENDPQTGLKFYYSAPPAAFPDQRRVFSVGGTQGLMDVYADFNMGAGQVKSPFFQMAKERLLKDLLAGHDIDITGHSLGGVPAGVLAYQLHMATQGVRGAGHVRLITWNGLGARDYLARQGDFSPEGAASLDAVNYHVQGDIVWRLGNRLGPDVALPGPGGFRPITSHVVATIADTVDTGRGLQRAVPIEHPWSSRLAPVLAHALGWVGDILQHIRYRIKEGRIVRNLLDARLEWARQEGYANLHPEFDPWAFEVNQIRERARARHAQALVNLIDHFERRRQEILAQNRMRRTAANESSP